MDYESRNLYREKLSQIARRSDLAETDVAREALLLAQQAQAGTYRDPRSKLRQSHIGYYLIGEGRALLYQKVGFKPDFVQSLRAQLHLILTNSSFLESRSSARHHHRNPALADSSQRSARAPAAFHVGTCWCRVHSLPCNSCITWSRLSCRRRFYRSSTARDGIPDDCVTLVAIPTLLLSEKQVLGLVEDLEVRFLGNHDRNIHFALVTDLPDSDEPASESSPLIDLCANLIRELDERYSGKQMGSFFLLASPSRL